MPPRPFDEDLDKLLAQTGFSASSLETLGMDRAGQVQATLISRCVEVGNRALGLGPVTELLYRAREVVRLAREHAGIEDPFAGFGLAHPDPEEMLVYAEYIATSTGRTWRSVNVAEWTTEQWPMAVAAALGLDHQPWVPGAIPASNAIRYLVMAEESFLQGIDVACHAWLYGGGDWTSQPAELAHELGITGEPGPDYWAAITRELGPHLDLPETRTATRDLMAAGVGRGLIHCRVAYCLLIVLSGEADWALAKEAPASHMFVDRSDLTMLRSFLLVGTGAEED
ncbi:MAG: hypothetical protein ACRD0J_03535 [Acidimicrobiales bacterium]